MARRLIGECVVPGPGGRVARVWWDAEWEEFRVTLPGQPAASYHTGSLSDARETAAVMTGPGAVFIGRAFQCPPGRE